MYDEFIDTLKVLGIASLFILAFCIKYGLHYFI